MLADLLTDPVLIERETVTGRDSLGNDVVTWAAVSPPELLGRLAGLPPSESGGELRVDRDTVIDRRVLDLPWGTDIQPRDRVTVGGRLYDVDGAPDDTAVSPLTGIGYVSAALRRASDG